MESQSNTPGWGLSQMTRQVVAERNANVARLVVDRLAAREVDRRVDLVISAVALRETLGEEQEEVAKPDVQYATETGEPVKYFSPGRKAQQEKLAGKIDRLERALSQALGQGDYSGLSKLLESKN